MEIYCRTKKGESRRSDVTDNAAAAAGTTQRVKSQRSKREE